MTHLRVEWEMREMREMRETREKILSK